MRTAARTDANHRLIVEAYRACGAQVLSLASLGKGVPDLLVCHNGRLMLVEVKDGSKPPSGRKLTTDQEVFHALWPVKVVTSDQEAVFSLVTP